MDNEPDKEHLEGRRNSNTEYVPTKCRITKPPPPKPATNPLQFIKVAPCPLFQKAQEQIKKVEEIKKERKEIREEAEDWQANLDNWKSSRRKRQEHIIERVVEVKKLAEEEHDRQRRKSKTFSEMIEDRSKGRHKFTIPVYDDDANDLSDYGIGSSSSKTNSIKDADTDDSSSILDEKEQQLDFTCNNQETSNISNIQISSRVSNQSKHEETKVNDKLSSDVPNSYSHTNNSNLVSTIKEKPNLSPYTPFRPKEKPTPPAKPTVSKLEKPEPNTSDTKKTVEQYTYEGAIQDYRSRIRSKINLDESVFSKSEGSYKGKAYSGAQVVVPKGEIFKRKEVFEAEKPVEIKTYQSKSTRRLSEDFANTQSIKQRLKSLEQCTDQAAKGVSQKDLQLVSVKERLQSFTKQNDNTNNNHLNNNVKKEPSKISNYLIKKSHSSSSFPVKNSKPNATWQSKEEISDRSSSPETEMYMNKLNIFNRDLDNLMMYNKSSNNLVDNRNEEFYLNSNYAPSTSSTEFLGLSSDREDSGIHTADVSCSVSQADESVDSAELASKHVIISGIDNFSEKKNGLEENHDQEALETQSVEFCEDPIETEFVVPKSSTPKIDEYPKKDGHVPDIVGYLTKDSIIKTTQDLLDSLRKDASEDLKIYEPKILPAPKEVVRVEIKPDLNKNKVNACHNKPVGARKEELPKPKPVIYENVEIKPFIEPLNMNLLTNDLLTESSFPLLPPKLEPPKVKPPPPPPQDAVSPVADLNPTQRIKKEINVKRSSFLGLYESIDDQLEQQIPVERPPDINYFLQKESKLEKSLYKKIQEESRLGMLSKVASQDSGLDIDRGRLSSDTWCSSVGESTTPSHDRQDSDSSFFQHTNSITSEEDEITKKEREIIEMVEKEEKSRDTDFNAYPVKPETVITNNHSPYETKYTNQFNTSYYNMPSNYLDDRDSEVLKVEQELRQLEQEELERQKDNLLFRESRAKAHLHNRHSLENLCDEIFPPYDTKMEYRRTMSELKCIPQEYRKSMPDVLNNYNLVPEVDIHYRKSMPDIQQMYKVNTDYSRSAPESPAKAPVDHRKSLPEIQHDLHRSAFTTPGNRQPIMPGRPLRPLLKDQKDRYGSGNPSEQQCYAGKPRQLSRHSLHSLSAVPRPKHTDSWVRTEPKSYNQHWLFQEAELRRIQEQQKNLSNQNRQQSQPKKHIPDSIIQTLTRRVQNRANSNDWNPMTRRPAGNNYNKDYLHHQYPRHSKNMGHALPMPYVPSVPVIDSQERMLSVSGKKKCSYCGNELGRGAAMIIESLCLFYHMECFKCCVCHVQLGDGLMGTDVRVRNQKLHCHNCYSSDDGVKFSCV